MKFKQTLILILLMMSCIQIKPSQQSKIKTILASQEFKNIQSIIASIKNSIVEFFNPNNALPKNEQPDVVEIKLIDKIKTLKIKTDLFFDRGKGEWFTREELEKKAQDLGYELFINPNNANRHYSTDREHPRMIITTIYGVDTLWERFNPTAKKMVKTAESEYIKNDVKPEGASGILNNIWNIVQKKPFTSMIFLGYSAICGAIINAYYNLYQKYKNAPNKRDKKTIIREILDPANLLGITVPFIFLIVVGQDLLEPIK